MSLPWDPAREPLTCRGHRTPARGQVQAHCFQPTQRNTNQRKRDANARPGQGTTTQGPKVPLRPRRQPTCPDGPAPNRSQDPQARLGPTLTGTTETSYIPLSPNGPYEFLLRMGEVQP